MVAQTTRRDEGIKAETVDTDAADADEDIKDEGDVLAVEDHQQPSLSKGTRRT